MESREELFPALILSTGAPDSILSDRRESSRYSGEHNAGTGLIDTTEEEGGHEKKNGR